jgi:hypothetical protein
MEKGYNSDIRIFGDFYHIQTEDWGPDSLVVVTRVFKNGAVIRSFKTPYADLIKTLPNLMRRQKVRDTLRIQHHKILDLLQSGQMFYEKSKIEM